MTAVKENAIVVEAQNPLQLTEDDLEDYVEDLRTTVSEFDVISSPREPMRPGMRAVTWWEVVHVYLPELGGDARGVLVGMVLQAALQWARRRFRRAPKSQPDHRPKCVIIHDHTGAEIDSMVLRTPADKPVTKEQTVQPESTRIKTTKRRRAMKRPKAKSRKNFKPSKKLKTSKKPKSGTSSRSARLRTRR